MRGREALHHHELKHQSLGRGLKRGWTGPFGIHPSATTEDGLIDAPAWIDAGAILKVVRDIVEIRRLPVAERLQLVGEIWDSILEDPALLPVSEELALELNMRLSAHRADPGSSISWEIVDREVFGAD